MSRRTKGLHQNRFPFWTALIDTGGIEIPAHLRRVARAVKERGGKLLITGGWVRDTLLQRSPRDLDLDLFLLSDREARGLLARSGRLKVVGKSFPITKWLCSGCAHDLKIHPTSMDLEADAAERDLTINALYIDPLDGNLIDPCGGLADLRAMRLRHTSAHFGSDPVRKLRVVRLATQLGFEIHADTVAVARRLRFSAAARERVFEELRATLDSNPDARRLVLLWGELEFGADWPECASLLAPPTREQTAARLERGAALCSRARDPFLHLLAVFVEGLESAARASWLERIVDSARVQTVQETIAAGHLLLTSEDGLMSLARAGTLEEHLDLLRAWGAGERADQLAGRAADLGWSGPMPDPWIRGRDLLALGMRPGPELGALLEAIYHKQLLGELSSRGEALQWARGELGGDP